MKRVALFLGCFLVSTGIVVWLVGGIRSPLKPEEDRVPAERPEDSTAGKLHPLMNEGARGVYIGTVSGGELNRFEEIIHDDGTVEHIPRVTFRYDSAEPSSSKLGVVQGLSGTFYDSKGTANAYVTSDRGSVRLDEKTDEVSLILLEGNVRFEERSGDQELGLLASSTLAIRFASSDASTPDDPDTERTPTLTRPVLSTDDRVTIRKDGMLLSGDGFHGDVELRDFRIDSNVVLVVESGAGLAMPDMLGSGGEPDEDGGVSMRIESGGALVLRGAAPEDETKEGAKTGSWGVSEASVQFVDRTVLVQGEQTFEAGSLEIGLRAAAPPKPDAPAATTETDTAARGKLQAQRLFGSNGVVFRDGNLELEARTLEWTATDEPLTLSGSPRIVMRQAGGSPLFGEAGSESSSGLITVMCSDRIELSTDAEAASREVQCFGDVRIFEGREFDADQPGLSADHMTLAIDESSEAATLDELIATGSVEIRDPEFVLTGGRFELVRSKNDADEFDLVMSRGAQLRLSGAPIEGFRMDLLPGAGSEDKADAVVEPKDKTKTEIVARAADRIVVSRETEATTLVDFLGGFTMERRAGEDLIGELTSESMLLSLQKDAEGKSRLSSWNAGGNVHYESPEGTADGDHLSYSKNEGRVRLLGTRGAHRAILRFTDADGGEPQKLLAETFVYLVDSDAFEAQGRVEGEFTTDAIAWQSLTERGSGEDEATAPAAGADSTDETEEPEPPQRWRLQCDEADIALAREAEDDENEESPEDPESEEEPRTRTRLAYFDARGSVRLDGVSQRVRAEQVTYSAVKNNVIVRGTPTELAMLSTRDESVASTDDDPEREEWSSVESSWFDIDTDREVVRCEDGGVLTFHVEDLLARDRDATPERLVTTIACAGLMEFRRDRDASFHDDVRVMQIGEGDTAQRPRTKLTCGYMHVVLETEPEDPEDVAPAANESVGGLSVRKLTCEDNVVVRHKNPNIVASGEYLELLARETMIYVHGGSDNVFFRHDDGTLEPKSLRYDYTAGKVEIWQFNFVPSRRASKERN